MAKRKRAGAQAKRDLERLRGMIETGSEEEYDRLLAHLDRVLEVYARDRRGRIEKLLGAAQGYLARKFRKESQLTVRQLLAILKAIDLELDEFIAGLSGFSLELYLRELEWKAPRQVRSVKDRLARTEPMAGSLEELRAQVEGLEERRLSDRTGAERACFCVLSALRSKSAADLRCEAWGVLGAIYRARGKHSAAAHCLLSALNAASDVDLKARILQRACYLVGDHANEYSQAISVAETASHLYLSARNFTGVGKAFVACAVMHVHLGEVEAAIEMYTAALALLPSREWAHRVSAFQGLGMMYVEQRELERARLSLEDGRALLAAQEADTSWLELGFHWLSAEILLVEGDLARAGRHFRKVREGYLKKGNVFDLTAVALRLAKVLLLQGDSPRFHELANQMASFLTLLEKHKYATAGLTHFLRMTNEGRVDQRLLDRLYLLFRRRGRLAKAKEPTPRGTT